MAGPARYTVKFVAGEHQGSLLVVLSPSQPCSALCDAVRKRRKDLTLDGVEATIHLEEAAGPELYAEDALSDVLPGAKEAVVVVFKVHPVNTKPQERKDSPILNGNSLKIRVITPELARSRDIDAIRTLPNAVALSCTLREFKARVQEHLGFPEDDGTCPELECNCKVARQVDDNAVLNERGDGDYEASRTVIVVHGNNEIVAVPVADLTWSAIREAAKTYVEQPNKTLTDIGGVEDGMQSTDDRRYLKAPVLAVCSNTQHGNRAQTNGGRAGTASENRELIVDIHTLECPMELTAYNANITLADAGLEDCAIDGVLNIFAVQRWVDPQVDPQLEGAQGKAGIFKKSDAWTHPNGQSDRGISSMLSTLRVFAHITSGGTMEAARQDAVLHVIHLITRFPPAVRAAYILMRGETPRSPERAALSQSLYEVLKDIIPLRIVQSNPLRLLEGCRLLFGLILEKAKNIKLTKIDDAQLPYVGMRVYDLRNMITMEPVLSTPIQTKAGLLDRGFYRAFQQGGLLTWTNGNDTSKTANLDRAWSRMAILSGGTKTRIVAFDFDTVNTNTRYADHGDVSAVISQAEYSELSYLAGLCARNQLSVIPPSGLPSATPPVLTLDREGSLAVYIGRAGCGGAGDDILMFRPTSANEEEGVDVSIITQMLEPILTQRKADGTSIFEAYGDQHRKVVAPDEIAIICIDLSQSMNERCGFEDVENNEDADAQIRQRSVANVETPSTTMAEDPVYHLPDADELKEYIRSHESYDDCLAIVHTGRDDFQRRLNAEKVLKIFQQLDKCQIEAKAKELERLRQRSSHYHYRTRADNIERDLGTIKNRCMRLQKYTTLLCAWLLTCVGTDDSQPDPLLWEPGEPIPEVPRALRQNNSNGPKFEIPRDLCCHIGSEIMDDPVKTVDGFTYDRKNIERWFQSNEKSPLTNLVLDSLDLVPDVGLKEEIATFLSASDITSKYTALRGGANLVRVALKSPLDTWSLMLPRNLKAKELWEIAFRLTKGRYSSFDVQHRNVRVPPNESMISSILNPDHTVFITPTNANATSNGMHVTEELCLVKVYDWSYTNMVVSYWEPKNSTRSIGSAIFRYYRAKLTASPTGNVEEPHTLWTGLRNVGDGHLTGSRIEGPWERISAYFTASRATGKLQHESCIDSGDDEPPRNYTGSAQPLVFKLSLGRPPSNSGKKDRGLLSRLDVLKQMFDAFINRLLAYNFQTHIGLVTFGTKASVSQEITNAVENFRHKLNSMTASGDTAVWDSIALAQYQLETYAEKFPETKMRIVCISDGDDNKSLQSTVHVAKQLCRRGIVLDCFCLGEASNADLQIMSYLTGGYIFEPKTLEEAMAICELEPVLSILERPKQSESNRQYRSAFQRDSSLYNFRWASVERHVQHVSRDTFPERKEHPGLSEDFVELGTFARSASQTRTDGNLRQSRIHTEIRNSGAHPHPDYDIYICEPNMGLWKVVMQGPPESTYAGGTFLLYIEMGADYPMFAPTARFVTPIYHHNINRHGRICHSILDRNWTVDTSNKDLIDTIYSLLLVPEFSDPINTVVTLNYHWDEVQFKEEAQKHIAKHASKLRAEWREEIVG